jgi:hypothetical protein
MGRLDSILLIAASLLYAVPAHAEPFSKTGVGVRTS